MWGQVGGAPRGHGSMWLNVDAHPDLRAAARGFSQHLPVFVRCLTNIIPALHFGCKTTMPKKGKRSEAAKLHYQKFHEFRCASTTEQAECVGPQNSGKAKMSVTSNASVKQAPDTSPGCLMVL